MKKYLFLTLFLILSNDLAQAKTTAISINCSSSIGIKTAAEIKFLVSQNIYNLNVTFIGQRPTDQEADRVIRNCLSVAIKRDGSKDILGSPWFRARAGDNENDDEILHPWGGLKFIVYESSTKKVVVRSL